MPSNHVIDIFLNPKAVAVIGASKNPIKGGYRIINNLLTNNYKGNIYPVNPNSNGEVLGLKFKKSILEIEEEIDLAIFYTPNTVVPDILIDCIKKNVKGALIETAGFEEVGLKGLELRDKIQKVTDNFSKIRIVGPNCMGLTKIDGDSDSGEKGGFFSGFGVFDNYKKGNIAIITQSGMLNGGYLRNLMKNYPGMGIRYSCSIGNKMDLSEVEFLDYFLNDPTVNVIALYLESFKDPRKFIELCTKARKIPNKTIILLKGGVTSLGKKASLSHTGSLAEDDQLIKAIIKQSGIIQAENLHDLFQFARTFSLIYKSEKNLPIDGNVCMMAGSGGAGTISADLTMKYGLNFPILGEQTYKILKEVYPEWMPPNRFALLDLWPTFEKAMMNEIRQDVVMMKIWAAILSDPNVEGVFNMMFMSSHFSNRYNIKEMAQYQTDKIIFMWTEGEPRAVRRISKLFSKVNIPTFPSLEEMIRNFAILVQESRNKRI
ncbi:MAG: CoA-binding protein [Promethearchaeota archaeon]|jgi:acetyltransferase